MASNTWLSDMVMIASHTHISNDKHKQHQDWVTPACALLEVSTGGADMAAKAASRHA